MPVIDERGVHTYDQLFEQAKMYYNGTIPAEAFRYVLSNFAHATTEPDLDILAGEILNSLGCDRTR